jgi:type III pantothenate kinase
MASLIADGTSCIDVVDKMLTLEGLNYIYNKNRNADRKPEAQ